MIYVVTVKPGGASPELDAAAALRRAGYEAHVPRALRRYRKGKEHYYTAEVMFDGYVFVSLPAELSAEDYYKIRAVRLVGNFLSRKSSLSDSEEEYIAVMCRDPKGIGVSSGYIKDGKLIVTDGWLKRFADRIVKYSVRQHKATVEIPIYGIPHRITCTIDIDRT